jgi:hypothetical protein
MFTFLANRFRLSFGPVPALGCETIFGLKQSPVQVKVNRRGIVKRAAIDTETLEKIKDGKIQPVTGIDDSTSTTAAKAAVTMTATVNASKGDTIGKARVTSNYQPYP